MLVCKLDASGTDRNSPIVTMGGYVGLLPAWMEFEVGGRAVLDRYSVEVLHAKEFYDTKGDFEGWSRTKKCDFVSQLQEQILGKFDLAVSFSIVKAEFLKAKKAHNVAHRESAFGYCFRTIVRKMLDDSVLKLALGRGQQDITFVLESGDENAGDARRIFDEAKKLSPWHDRVLRSFGFADKKSSVGLQIGDLLAVTLRKHADKYSPDKGLAPASEILKILDHKIYLMSDVAYEFRGGSKAKKSA